MLQLPGPMPHDFIPLFGMLTGIVTMVVIGFTIVKVAQSQIGQAIARRLHGKGALDPELREELYELREQVAGLEHRLAESEERLDFAERLLARPNEPEPLPGASRTEQH
jgi:antitoxin component of MazEF toxin-antitoxin module